MKTITQNSTKNILSKFKAEEEGAGMVFGLFLFATMAAVLGLALDFTNGWRNRTYLSSTADIAAHAGAAAMAAGATQEEVIDVVEQYVAENMPTSLFGNVLDADADIIFASYDPDTASFSDTDVSFGENSVVVKLGRNESKGNPVSTYLLGFVGIDALDVHAVSASVADRSGLCNRSDGIYAKGQVRISSQGDIGGGFCLHSENAVWLPQQNEFQPGSMVSMPDLDDCKSKCTNDANPGIYAVEAHMVLGDFGTKISDTYAEFMSPIGVSDVKYGFFYDDPLDPLDPVITLGDTTELVEVAGLDDAPALGDIVELTNTEIMSIQDLPSGLVYSVQCTAKGNGPKTSIDFSETQARMNGSVLLTNCSLDFGAGSSVRSSVIITTRDSSSAAISADNDVTIGDPTQTCDSTERSFIMSASGVSVPSEFVLSNVTLIVDDNVNIASATSSNPTSYGFAIYASGEVKVASQHTFRSCGEAFAGDLAPEPKTLRLVAPPSL